MNIPKNSTLGANGFYYHTVLGFPLIPIDTFSESLADKYQSIYVERLDGSWQAVLGSDYAAMRSTMSVDEIVALLTTTHFWQGITDGVTNGVVHRNLPGLITAPSSSATFAIAAVPHGAVTGWGGRAVANMNGQVFPTTTGFASSGYLPFFRTTTKDALPSDYLRFYIPVPLNISVEDYVSQVGAHINCPNSTARQAVDTAVSDVLGVLTSSEQSSALSMYIPMVLWNANDPAWWYNAHPDTTSFANASGLTCSVEQPIHTLQVVGNGNNIAAGTWQTGTLTRSRSPGFKFGVAGLPLTSGAQAFPVSTTSVSGPTYGNWSFENGSLYMCAPLLGAPVKDFGSGHISSMLGPLGTGLYFNPASQLYDDTLCPQGAVDWPGWISKYYALLDSAAANLAQTKFGSSSTDPAAYTGGTTQLNQMATDASTYMAAAFDPSTFTDSNTAIGLEPLVLSNMVGMAMKGSGALTPTALKQLHPGVEGNFSFVGTYA
jgi:hypothetical protein